MLPQKTFTCDKIETPASQKHINVDIVFPGGPSGYFETFIQNKILFQISHMWVNPNTKQKIFVINWKSDCDQIN